jgi:RNA polymerase-interacting CarD/CdnL/TRCF family regulator
MDLSIGDIVSGKDIQYGRYSGVETISKKEFFKVEDLTKKVTHFIAIDELKTLRKLPTKKEIAEKVKIFKDKASIDIGEIEGSRYKYFKAKLEIVDFEKSLEVLHDMASLKIDGELNSSEKKLYSVLKEKMSIEVSFVLGKSLAEVNSILDFPQLAA